MTRRNFYHVRILYWLIAMLFALGAASMLGQWVLNF
jgi:hypothetical protein